MMTGKLSVTIAQKILYSGVEQMWEFVLVLSDVESGLLTTRVLLCHPDWPEPQEIACVESSPHSFHLRVCETNCDGNKR